jgi:integrase
VPLTDRSIRSARPRPRPFKLWDERGLYLEVRPTGGRWWRLKYRFGGKEKRLSLGVYPDVTLKLARERRDAARALLERGIDPALERKIQKAAEVARAEGDFEAVAREWVAKHTARWTERHREQLLGRLERGLFRPLGGLPIGEIEPLRLLAMLRVVEARSPYTAHRLLQDAGRIFSYAIATGRASRNPATDLRGALTPTVEKHFATITEPKAIGELLRAIEGYSGSFLTKQGLTLLAYTFVRPGELRGARWEEFSFDDPDGPIWRIPAGRMKSRADHLIPLSRQAVAILRELEPLTGGGLGAFVLPSERSRQRCMSNNTLNAALRRLGYSRDEIVSHGFRRMASTRLNESQRWHRDAIERQLAHGEKDKVRAAYNAAQHLGERRLMMQWWADYLDGLRDGATVLPFRRPAS